MSKDRRDMEVVITTRNQTRQGLTDAERYVRQFQKTVEGVSQALSALGFKEVFSRIASGVNSAIDAYNRLRSSQSGVSAVADKMGQSLSDVNRVAQELVDDGLMGIADASTSVKNLLAANFDLTQTRNLLIGFRDAAAFGRQGALGFGEAIRTATEGIKNGNSILVDNAGITKNLSVILKEAGFSAQDLANVQSDVNVRNALYNGLLKEMALFQGDAARLSGELAGQQARTAAEAEKLRAAFGEALAPAIAVVNEEGRAWLQTLRNWVEVNPEVARGLTLAAGSLLGAAAGVAGLAASINILQVGLTGLTRVMGPIGWTVAAVIALGGAVAGASVSARAAAEEQRKQEDQVLRLATGYDRLTQALLDSNLTADEKKRITSDQKRVIQELGDLMPELVTKWDAEGRALEINTEKWRKYTEEILRNKRVKAGDDREEAANQLQDAEKALDLFLKMREMRRRAYVLERIQAAGPTVQLDSQLRAQWEKELGEEYDRLAAADESRLRKNVAQAQAMVAKYQAIIDGMDFVGPPAPRTPPTDEGYGFGSGQSKDPVAAALRQLEFLQNTAQITATEYVASLEEIKRTHKLSADQQMDIDEKIYRARQKLIKDATDQAEQERKARVSAALRLLDFQQRIGATATQDEVDRLREILTEFDLTADERMSILERYYDAQRRLEREQQQESERTFAARTGQISVDRRTGLAALAAELTDLEKLLIDAEAAQDTNWETAIRQTMLDRVRPVLETQKSALEALLADEQLTADQRQRVEDSLNQVKAELYQQDVSAHRIATEARVAADEQAAREREAAERAFSSSVSTLRKNLRQAQTSDLASLRQSQAADEARHQREITRLRSELELLEKRNREEDRSLRLAELRRRLADAEEQGPLEEYIDADGRRTWVNRQAMELREQLAEAEKEADRERERERLQEQIQREQVRLDALRETHRVAYEDRQTAWNDLLALDDDKLAELVSKTEIAMGEEGWYGTLAKWLSVAATTAEEKASAIAVSLEGAVKQIQATQDALRALEATKVPSLPIAPPQPVSGGSGGLNVGGVTVQIDVTGAADPTATAAAVADATRGALADVFDEPAAWAGVRFGKRLV